MTRRLMLIPIVHSEKEMGSLKSDISEMIDRKFGKENRDQHRKDVALSREILAITGITITEDGVPGKGARFEITVPKGMWRMVEANMTGN